MTPVLYTDGMRAVVTLDQIAERRRLGIDKFDEVWDGEYHMNAAPHPRHSFLLLKLLAALEPLAEARGLITLGEFNIGVPHDYRIPDAGYLDELPTEAFTSGARLVIEMLSRRDETMDKLPLYARYGVDEVLIVDPATRGVVWLGLDQLTLTYRPVDRSAVLGLTAADVAAQLPWERIES